jgi:hypothetical protein
MSSQILDERRNCCEVLEKTQSGSLYITEWLTWFLECLDRAVEQSNRITSSALEKGSFWLNIKEKNELLNPRQKKVLNGLFSGLEGKLTCEKWMKLTKASSRTALRDIEESIDLGVLEHGLPLAPILVVDLRSVFGAECRHSMFSFDSCSDAIRSSRARTWLHEGIACGCQNNSRRFVAGLLASVSTQSFARHRDIFS